MSFQIDKMVSAEGKGVSTLQKPDKIYLENSAKGITIEVGGKSKTA